ncbi:hypothetical protein B0T12DRAFT_30809 [Alternaria alternata]|nr:hypothetical protein B0T12DRAFT_30809 [Alternaria alternata]
MIFCLSLRRSFRLTELLALVHSANGRKRVLSRPFSCQQCMVASSYRSIRILRVLERRFVNAPESLAENVFC